MDSITADTIIVLALLFAVVTVIRVLAEALNRRRLLAAHLSDEATRSYLEWSRASARDGALRWGIVWTSIGLALILVDLLPVELASPTAYGIVLVSGGAGLLLYRLLASRERPWTDGREDLR